MKILIFYDRDFNGKTGKSFKNFFTCDKCILNYNNNLRFNLHNIQIIDNNIYYENKCINNIILESNIVIFNYNEDKTILKCKDLSIVDNFLNKFTNWDNYIIFLQHIKFLLRKINNNIIIYNNPNNNLIISNTQKTYEFINSFKNKIINVPKSIIIKNKNDLYNSYFNYPLLIHLNEQSSGENKYLCNNYEELINNYDKLIKFVNDSKEYLCYKNDISICTFLNSYIPELNCKTSIRFMCINNKLIDYFNRPSNDWNIHHSNLIFDRELLIKSDKYLENYIKNNNKYLNNFFNEIYNKLGPGFYCYDCLIDNNELYLLEIGYKSYNVKYDIMMRRNNIILNKKHENINEYIKLYNSLII